MSFHENFSAYFPTASAAKAFTAGLNIGSVPGAGFSGSPGTRRALVRSSSHKAHGHASRKNLNVYDE